MALLHHRPSQAPRLAQASACGNGAPNSRCVASRLRTQAARAPSTSATNNQLVMAKQQIRLAAGPQPPKAASLAGDIITKTPIPGLSSSQGAVVLLGTAAVMAVTADAGLPGLVAVTGLAGSWLYPAEFAALAGLGTRVGQVVSSRLRTALGLNRPAPSYSEPLEDTQTTAVARVEDKVDTAAIAAQPVIVSTATQPHGVPQALPCGWGVRSAESVTATATSASAGGQPSAAASAHAAAQLSKRGSVGKVTLAAQCVELPLRVTGAKGLVSVEQLLYRGGISVASTSPEVLARKHELLASWKARAQAEGGADSGNFRLPRVEGITSIEEVFTREWSALRLFVETPEDWSSEGAKVATWGDLKVVAAYGIAADESVVSVEASAGGGSLSSGVGTGGVGSAEGAVIGAGAYVVAAGGVAAAGGAAAGAAAAAKSPRGPAARKQRRNEAKKQASKGVDAGKLLRAAAQAVPLVAAVLAAKVSLLVDAF